MNLDFQPAADEFAHVLRTRRTVNDFREEVPPLEVVLQGIELARWAPNHKMTQPWRFHLLGPETIRKVLELNTQLLTQEKGAEAAGKKRAKWAAIPGWIVVTFQTSADELRHRENYAAVCCAIQNLLLFLWSRDIGTKWATGGITREPEFNHLLKIDSRSEQVVGLIWYGYPASLPASSGWKFQRSQFLIHDIPDMTSLKITNPHSVLAALEMRPHDVLEIHASRRTANEGWKRVMQTASRLGIPVREPLRTGDHDQRRNRDGGRPGTTFAVLREKQSVPLDELFGPEPATGLWLAFDQLQDPHNVGAIFRTAAFFGVQGILLTVDRSAPLSPTVYDVASGGIEHVPFTLQTNLSQGLEKAKKQNLWVLGSSEHASTDVRTIDRDRRWLLVVGNEEKGLRRLTQDRCDQLCSIPAIGSVGSLNVSVATGILIASLTAPTITPS